MKPRALVVFPRVTVCLLLGKKKSQILKTIVLALCFDDSLTLALTEIQCLGEVLMGGAVRCRCCGGRRSLGPVMMTDPWLMTAPWCPREGDPRAIEGGNEQSGDNVRCGA